jgi:methylated-DNA-[protein]-cysteine S-methyltransferase
VIPCHRLIGSDGGLRGYLGGTGVKRWLLDHEQRVVAMAGIVGSSSLQP